MFLLAAYAIYFSAFFATIYLPAIQPTTRQALATLGEATSTSLLVLGDGVRRAGRETTRIGLIAARPVIIVYSYQPRPRFGLPASVDPFSDGTLPTPVPASAENNGVRNHPQPLPAPAILPAPPRLTISSTAHNSVTAAPSFVTLVYILFITIVMMNLLRQRHALRRGLTTFLRRFVRVSSGAPTLPAAFDIAMGLAPVNIPPPALIPEVFIPALEEALGLFAPPLPSSPDQDHLPATPERPPTSTITPRPNTVRRRRDTPPSPIAGPSGLHLSSGTHLALSTPVRHAYAALEAADNRALSTSGQKRLHGMVAGAKLWGNRRVLDPVSPSVFNATTDDVQADDAEEESDEETGRGGKGRGAHLSEKARGKLREL
ncbi:hypothetical protein C8R43DRAFT_1019310 [Mycena crocata]|nr:hypothetical protein C8R43DRAFT_1019310 [Mycena crocata]